MAPGTTGTRTPFRFTVCLLLYCCLSGCGWDAPPGGDAPSAARPTAANRTPLTVNVVRIVWSENVLDTVSYYGILEPQRTSSLGFARGGRVEEVLAVTGDIVARGQRLASLEQQLLESQGAGVSQTLAEARADLSNLTSGTTSAVNQRQVADLQSRIAALATRQREINLELEKGVITAPYSGIIADRNVHEGDVVQPGRPALRILEDAPQKIDIDVAAELADRLEVGWRAVVLRRGDSREASIVRKGPEVDRYSGTLPLTLHLASGEAAQRWLFGDAVEIQFTIPTTESGFWLPHSALQRATNGLWSVLVVETDGSNERVARRTLEVGRLDDQMALVRGALQSGDRVIVDGSNRIVPGQRITSREVGERYQVPAASEVRE